MKSVVGVNIIGDNELYPIYGLVGKPFWQTKVFYIVLALIVVLLSVLIVTFLVKKYKKSAPKESYLQKTLRELKDLKNFLLQGKISNKDFYLKLTEIVKNYLFGRFGYDLFGLTDHEMVNFLQSENFDSILLESIKNMFLSMEVVKFANAKTVKELMEKDLLRCLDLVNKTTIKNWDQK